MARGAPFSRLESCLVQHTAGAQRNHHRCLDAVWDDEARERVVAGGSVRGPVNRVGHAQQQTLRLGCDTRYDLVLGEL